MKAINSSEVYSSDGFVARYIDGNISVLSHKTKLYLRHIHQLVGELNDKGYGGLFTIMDGGVIDGRFVSITEYDGIMYVCYCRAHKIRLDEVNNFIEWLNEKTSEIIEKIIYKGLGISYSASNDAIDELNRIL